MRKLKVLILFALLSMTATAQILQGEGVKSNNGFSLGIIGGAFGVYDDVTYAGVGMNFTIYGAYIDFLFMPRANANSTDVKKHDDEKETLSFHVGYMVPLTKWLSITPIAGYTSVKNGVTDGSHWTTTSSGINNSYIVKDEAKGFDYGGILGFHIGEMVRLYAAGTRYGIYGGIGFHF